MKLNKNQELLFQRVQDILKDNKVRITKVRQDIIKIIIVYEHPTINDIIAYLEQQTVKINIMSVYNTLDMLLENHVLYANTFNGKNICYELKVDKMCHLKCDLCFKIFHLTDFNDFFKEFSEIAEKYNWSCDHFKIEIHGKCDSCIKKIIK